MLRLMLGVLRWTLLFITFVLHDWCFHPLMFSFSAKPPMLNISYKPQKISPKSRGSVRQLLHEKIRDAYIHPQFVTDVVKPLHVDRIFDQEVCTVLFFCILSHFYVVSMFLMRRLHLTQS